MSHRSIKSKLRQLHLSELVVGQPLPADVRDRDGMIVFPSRTLLTPKQLQHIAERYDNEVFTDDSWPAAAPLAVDEGPRAVTELTLDVMKRRTRSAGDGRKIRRSPRYAYRGQLPITVALGSGLERSYRHVVVETSDLSAEGFAFLSAHYVHPGTIVYPRFDRLPGRPVRKGIVRNCILLGGARHRVGVQFVPFDPGETPPESPH